MKEKVYITGHKNPDTDSICAAITYAELKNKRGDVEAIPIRIGELGQETKWVLSRWGFEAPEFIGTLKQRIQDLDLDIPFCITPDVSINKAARFLQEKDMQSLPVVNEKEELTGIVTLSNLTRSYMEVWDDKIIWRANTSIDNIVDVISGKVINYPDKPKDYDGRIVVYASSVDEDGHLSRGDILIVGNRREVHKEAIDRDISILILSSGSKMEDDILELAIKKNIVVLSTKYNSYMVSRLLPQAIPVSFVMTRESLTYFYPDDYLEDVEKMIKNKRYRSFPVLDRTNKVMGSLSRNDLLFENKKKLILVDHNERNQSIDDFDKVEILEIIDHHRVANIMTNSPIYFRNVPVGSTCTIIAMMYFEQGVTPSKGIAGLLASAIISDTLLFRSPTTTETDKQILLRLSRLAEIDPEEYAVEMFSAGTSLENQSLEDILLTDSKVFNIRGLKVKVSQTFTTELEKLDGLEDRIIEKMKELKQSNSDDIFCLLMTDIFAQKTNIIVVGDYGKNIAKELGVEYKSKGFIVENLLSRKKQFIPAITSAIARVEEGIV